MKPVIIFGAGTVARLAWRCFEEETPYTVGAFCVDDAMYAHQSYCGLPVISATQLEKEYLPSAYSMFVALGCQELNALRASIYEKYVSLGYSFVSCISSRALIMNGGKIGRNSFIMEGAIVQPFSSIGDNCVCWSGCAVSHESSIGNHCFLAAQSAVGGMSSIGEYSFLGMRSAVHDGLRIGRKCLVGAGSLVLSDLPDHSRVAEKATLVASASV